MPPVDPNYHRKFTRFAIGVIVMVGLAIGLYNTVHGGYYPAAIVGFRMVSAHTLNEAVDAVVHYYNQALKTYEATDASLSEKQVSRREARRLTLDKMIENEFIARELEVTVGDNLPSLMEKKINIAELNDPEFVKAVATLYGLTPSRFQKLILEPQAREEILQSEKFGTKVEDFKSWLTETRKSKRVVILEPNLKWDHEKGVVSR